MGFDPSTQLESDDLPALLKVAEVAQLLRVDRATAYRWVRSGELPVVKFGTTVRVSRRALLERLGQL